MEDAEAKCFVDLFTALTARIPRECQIEEQKENDFVNNQMMKILAETSHEFQ